MMTKKEVTQLSNEVSGCAIKVHKELGPSLLESVYQKCLKHELLKNGFKVDQHVSVPVAYDSICIETDLRLDLLVNDCSGVKTSCPRSPNSHLYEITSNASRTSISKSMKPFVNEYFKNLPD